MRRCVSNWKMISDALLSAASPQIRNMGTVGGNLLQRTRCGYFRDIGFPCNKRQSGLRLSRHTEVTIARWRSSASAIIASPRIRPIFPVALMALDTELELIEPRWQKPATAFGAILSTSPAIHRKSKPRCAPGEMIARLHVPGGAVARNSCYVKVRDRASFAFALVSAAVELDVADGMIRDARVALGGVGPCPGDCRTWRTRCAANGRNRRCSRPLRRSAGDGAPGAGGNDFKIELARRTVARALRTVAQRENL